MPTLPTPGTGLQLRYAQLQELVAGLLDVHPDRVSTLGARMRLFRLRGFPPDVISLGKTRFAYDLDAVLRVTLAFLMLDAFVPQESVPLFIERDWKRLRLAFGRAYSLVREKGDAEAAIDGDRPVLIILPKNLHNFTLEKETKGDPAGTADLQISTAREFAERMLGAAHGEEFVPMTVIDIQRLAGWVRNAILHSRWAGPELFDDFARS